MTAADEATPKAAITPSQAVGPFHSGALFPPAGGTGTGAGHPGALVLHGHLLDGAGQGVPDAVIEAWRPVPYDTGTGTGTGTGSPDSAHPIAATGRSSASPIGFSRAATDGDGHYTLHIPPRYALPAHGVPYIPLMIFAPELLRHLCTRAYPHDAPGLDEDRLLARVPGSRRATLITRPDAPRVHRFDIRLQSDDEREETVFLDFT
ncbi:protocatechuate 3,4-dioxygenase subunit alpha [Streptomyces sp. NPDC101181]|uniref:protocatechuate 3,4-dioxygenase subunit alpha n=1 Tax=Streptomyces sp. NPDC101181 TaxID=3366125 RepID=UPI0038048E38